jgi:hypothetical protein
MPDYGHDIQFGYLLSPDAADAGIRERVAAGREELSRA